MKEIGGYIELDTYTLPMRHEDALALNCGRNALAYLIEARNIKKICLPYFLCDSVKNVCKKYHVDIRYYHIKENFEPEDVRLSEDEWFYVVNYYGQVEYETLEKIKQKYRRVIVDNAQAYYMDALPDTDTIYTCRKYFGVSDGAFLYTDAILNHELSRDVSFERIRYILGRYEKSGAEFYRESVENNHSFNEEPIKLMSKLTRNLLQAIDYERVKNIRTQNFCVLEETLKEVNQLSLRRVEGAFMYPLFMDNADEIRKKCLENKIYIPTLWPNVLEEVPKEWIEWTYVKNILPIPCDQRYNLEDMHFIIKCIKE